VRSDTFVGALYKLLKAENIADRAESPYPQLSAEAIVAANPEVVVLVDDETPASVGARPGWDTIAAVQARRICELDDDQLSRPGPHIIDGLESLADCLYPDE
jgi:iron complex transport system substrate-binding protein